MLWLGNAYKINVDRPTHQPSLKAVELSAAKLLLKNKLKAVPSNDIFGQRVTRVMIPWKCPLIVGNPKKIQN